MAAPSTTSSPNFGPEHVHHHKSAGVTLPSIHQTHPELPFPSISASSSSRALHSLYPAATPPMSPAHVLPSPASRPHGFGPSTPGESSALQGPGFYQLPPPLQTFRPYEHHQHPLQASPTLQAVGSSYPSSLHSSPAFSAQPSPSLNPQSSSSGSTSSMPTLPPPHSASPGLGPISPYPTPQHQPIASPHPPSSPHQSPRYDRILPKQPTPSQLVLPGAVTSAPPVSSSSSSSTLVFSVQQPSRIYASASYPPGSPATSGTSPATGTRKRSSASSTTSPSSAQKNPRGSDSTKSAPSSPVYMMLPPKSIPPLGKTSKSASISGPSTAATSSDATVSDTALPSKRRTSSLGSKSVDQEAREMMRKVSHSAIERRRRERINDKILQLKHLVPACVDEDHLHKLSILQSTIEYIQYLKSCVPEHVANAKFKRASNNDPNNKTTDMLDALNAAVAAAGLPIRNKVSPFSLHKPLAFAPMITTGLNQPYKKVKIERVGSGTDRTPPAPLQFHGSHFNTAVAQTKESTRRASSTSASSPTSMGPSLPTHPPAPSSMINTDGRASTVDPSPLSAMSSSSDEDAKDGLLMLSQLSAGGPYSSPPESKMATAQPAQGHLGTLKRQKDDRGKKSAKNRRRASVSNARQISIEKETETESNRDVENDYVGLEEDEQSTEEDGGDDDYIDDDEGDDADDDDDDEDYIDESEAPKNTVSTPASKRVRRTSDHDQSKSRRSISKMSVDQMLC
ncbi:hypothetical protein BGW42_001067 [Actinomortierella wolfii]|nr:hypothetical protein BGW42_001067 [Actinomortierella wolfii]